jgi:hypothetical protein
MLRRVYRQAVPELTFGTIVMRRARSFSPKSMSSDPVAREVFLLACLAVFPLLKDHPLTFIVPAPIAAPRS